MGFYKSDLIDIIDDYARGASEFELAEKYDLPVEKIIDVIEQYYNMADEAV
jgi:uncharacterized protein (DUF433 family)